MYTYYNPNPEKNHVGDCVVRALTVALDDSWDNAFVRLMAKAYEQKGEKVWLNIAEWLGMLKEKKLSPVPLN